MPLSAPVALPRAADVLPHAAPLEAHSVEAAHAAVTELFCPHRLFPIDRSGVHMRLRSVHDAGLGLELLDYGGAVSITPEGLGDFHLVQIPLTGSASLTAGTTEVASSTAVATVPPIDRGFSMRWAAGTPHLIMYVARQHLVDAAANLYGLGDASTIQLAPQLRLDRPEGAAFLRAVFELHDTFERGAPVPGYARKLARDLVLTRLLQAVDNSVQRSLDAWSRPATRTDARGRGLAARFRAEAEAAVDEGLGVREIAARLGVPLRTLQDHLRAEDGSTPTAVLADVRFRRAHELLRQGDASRDSVSAIAARCGFGHHGRFAIEYRRRYGESPAVALRR